MSKKKKDKEPDGYRVMYDSNDNRYNMTRTYLEEKYQEWVIMEGPDEGRSVWLPNP